MLKRAAEIAVIVLIVVNGFELAFFSAIHRRAGLYRVGDQCPLPSGYLLNGRYRASDSAPCYLIRVYAKGCPYCRRDQTQYTRLMERAQKARCEMIAIAPVARDAELYGDSRVVQLQYIDMKFGRALNPFMTPETILLDDAGRVIWSEEGALDNQSVEQAIHALRKLR
jgi:thiol-disulfide isomerase/thioredoxin